MYKEVPCTPHPVITSFRTIIQFYSQKIDMGALHRAYSHFMVLHALKCVCVFPCIFNHIFNFL